MFWKVITKFSLSETACRRSFSEGRTGKWTQQATPVFLCEKIVYQSWEWSHTHGNTCILSNICLTLTTTLSDITNYVALRRLSKPSCQPISDDFPFWKCVKLTSFLQSLCCYNHTLGTFWCDFQVLHLWWKIIYQLTQYSLSIHIKRSAFSKRSLGSSQRCLKQYKTSSLCWILQISQFQLSFTFMKIPIQSGEWNIHAKQFTWSSLNDQPFILIWFSHALAAN